MAYDPASFSSEYDGKYLAIVDQATALLIEAGTRANPFASEGVSFLTGGVYTSDGVNLTHRAVEFSNKSGVSSQAVLVTSWSGLMGPKPVGFTDTTTNNGATRQRVDALGNLVGYFTLLWQRTGQGVTVVTFTEDVLATLGLEPWEDPTFFE